MSDFEQDARSGRSGGGWSADATRPIRSRDYINSVQVVTGTPVDEKGKEVEGSYGKPDHVLVGNGSDLVWLSRHA